MHYLLFLFVKWILDCQCSDIKLHIIYIMTKYLFFYGEIYIYTIKCEYLYSDVVSTTKKLCVQRQFIHSLSE